MRNITGVELSVIVNELQSFIGFYIDKFYELGDDRFRIKITKSGAQANLLIILSHTINKTEYIVRQENEMPTNFASAMRKRVSGFRIAGITQLNNDRIVVFELQKGDTLLNLIVEMFGKGNVIVADKDMKVLLAQKSTESKGRSIKTGAEYRPPEQPANYKMEKPEEISPAIYREDGNAVDYSILGEAGANGRTVEKYNTLQEVLDRFYQENGAVAGKVGKDEEARMRLVEELESSIGKQERLVSSLGSEIEDKKEAGRILLGKMGRVNEIINVARKNKRITKGELQEQFPDVKILNVDLKNKKITIELD